MGGRHRQRLARHGEVRWSLSLSSWLPPLCSQLPGGEAEPAPVQPEVVGGSGGKMMSRCEELGIVVELNNADSSGACPAPS